jgi:hypothetical protein
LRKGKEDWSVAIACGFLEVYMVMMRLLLFVVLGVREKRK